MEGACSYQRRVGSQATCEMAGIHVGARMGLNVGPVHVHIALQLV